METWFESPIGWICARGDAAALHQLHFVEAVLARGTGGPWHEPLDAYFAGDLTAFDGIRVAPAGTQFQREVWSALRAIPAGDTASYRDIARAVGRPDATRAVGTANGANPVGLVIPCHRVVRADGTIGGYAAGVERKRWLLDHEARHAVTARRPRLLT